MPAVQVTSTAQQYGGLLLRKPLPDKKTMTHLLSVREKMDALASGLQRAEKREKERKQLPYGSGSDDISTFPVTGIFDTSETMQEHHRQMAEIQREANKRILQDQTRF